MTGTTRADKDDSVDGGSHSWLDEPVPSMLLGALIVFSMLCFALETVPDIQPQTRAFLAYAEMFTVAVFTLEYLLRIYHAKDRLGFVVSPLGMIDLLAILPFYLATSLDLRTLRALRLLRLLRLLKLARYNRALARFSLALSIAKYELLICLFSTLIMVYLAAVGIYYFEHSVQPEVFRSILDALWWAVASLTTVGYGDIYPITMGGRLFTFCILILGLALVAMPAGIIASALTEARKLTAREP